MDILPDRSAELVSEWLKAHPGVEIISRDRGSEYIKGATDGAPDAIQVADPRVREDWHLLTNLRDALKQLLESKRACLKAAADKANLTERDHEEPPVSHADRLNKDTEVTEVLRRDSRRPKVK